MPKSKEPRKPSKKDPRKSGTFNPERDLRNVDIRKFTTTASPAKNLFQSSQTNLMENSSQDGNRSNHFTEAPFLLQN